MGFLGDKCEKEEECYSGTCKNGTCVRKEDGDSCKYHKQCGDKSFCSFNEDGSVAVCKKYSFEGEECKGLELQCSPQFVCINGKCEKKGTKDVGTAVSFATECKSFLARTINGALVCADDYNETHRSDISMKWIAERYPNMTWDGIKLSDRSGMNYGYKDILEKVYAVADKENLGYCNASTWKCARVPASELTLLTLYQTSQYTLNDTELKDFLFTEKKNEDPKGWSTKKKIIVAVCCVDKDDKIVLSHADSRVSTVNVSSLNVSTMSIPPERPKHVPSVKVIRVTTK